MYLQVIVPLRLQVPHAGVGQGCALQVPFERFQGLEQSSRQGAGVPVLSQLEIRVHRQQGTPAGLPQPLPGVCSASTPLTAREGRAR